MSDSCKHCDLHKDHHQDIEEKNNKIDIILYIISVFIFLLSFIPYLVIIRPCIYLVVVLLSGYKLISSGIENIIKFNFEEDTLMTIAIVAAFILGEFPESCMIILLYRLGEFMQDRAVDNSNKSIKKIVEIKAKTANVIGDNNKDEIVDVKDVKVGQKILIKPGEMVPLDCRILKGNSLLDTSSITGESKHKEVIEGEHILSGCINLTGAIEAEVEKDYKDSTASQIVDLVYEATNNKGKTEEFITRFSKIYTPVVCMLALIIAIIPPVFLNQDFKEWIYRSLVFLVASCPCSIVISVPLAFFSCIGAISKNGMIIKGTKHIENFAESKYVAMDKTGTITTGHMQIDKLVSRGNFMDDELIEYLYALEKNSNHPISTAIKKKIEEEELVDSFNVEDYEEIAGRGLKAKVNGIDVLFGNAKLLEDNNINEVLDIEDKNSASYIIIDGKLEGYVTFKEEIRENIKNTIIRLKSAGIKDVVMLTGDNEQNSIKIGTRVGIDKIYSQLLPQDKLEKVKTLKEDGKVIFIGDGINDSPVLAESDFGISMGEGAEIANSTADAILISNNITTLPKSLKISRKTMRIIKENIAFSLIVKAVVLGIGILGLAPVWLAVVADTGVSLLTVLNSVRIYKNSK